MAMIFVPSKGGISHAPQEYTAAGDIANGVDVLLRTLLAIDRGGPLMPHDRGSQGSSK
jgi:N-carbamoyl-L-amino-acid hydrolase